MKCPLKFSRYEFEGGEECVGAECGFYGGVCMDATNGMRGETNGIADEITLPDGDAVAILRDSDDGSVRMKAFAYDPHSLSKLADMIERDYVRREYLDEVRSEADYREGLLHESINDLEAERDEWKAKDEQAERNMANDMTNLEWLCKNAPSKLAKVISDGAVDCDWCAEDRLDNCSCECAKGNLEWLMAPHEDVHSKAQSKTEPSLTEQSESLSDDVDSKPTFEAPLYGWHEGESDSREKLEADVLEAVKKGFITYETLIGWLDRQEAITRRKCDKPNWDYCETCEWPSVAAQPDQEAYDRIAELQAKADELTAQLHASNAERARLRECLGIATDNAHDFLTLVDESGNVYDRDEGLA